MQSIQKYISANLSAICGYAVFLCWGYIFFVQLPAASRNDVSNHYVEGAGVGMIMMVLYFISLFIFGFLIVLFFAEKKIRKDIETPQNSIWQNIYKWTVIVGNILFITPITLITLFMIVCIIFDKIVY